MATRRKVFLKPHKIRKWGKNLNNQNELVTKAKLHRNSTMKRVGRMKRAAAVLQ